MSKKVFNEMVTYVKNMLAKQQEMFKQIDEEKNANQTRMNELLKKGSYQGFDFDLVNALEKKANQSKTEPELKSMIHKLVQKLK